MTTARDDDERTDPGPVPSDRDDFVRTLVVPPTGGDFGFDFDAFERSEAEAEAAGRIPRAIAQAVPVELERRTIVPRNWLPPGDSVVESRPVGNMTVVTLRGRINETFRGAELGQSLTGVVVFDLSQVDRISSFGVKGWLQMLEHARFTACYFFRCSEAVINQITMMRNFCGSGRIHSLLVPYLCGGCGEEFSAVYDAVADRESILGRSPVLVECPRCASSAKIADDPWAYLAIDEHLLDSVPADLEQVLEHTTQMHRMDPIEKFVSDDETRIRINSPLDARLRLSRALTGLEGKVAFDLTPRPDLSATGVQRLLDAISELEAEVTEVWIDGATRPLIEALLHSAPPRTYVSTAWVTAIAPDTGIRRPVLIDVRKKRAGLARGEMPPVDAGWAVGALKYEDAEAVFSAARNLLPRPVQPSPAPAPRTQTPPPIARQPFHSQQYQIGDISYPGVGATEPLRPAMVSGLHRPSELPVPERTRGATRRNRMLIWQFAAFGAVTVVLAGLTFAMVFYVMYRGLSSTRVADVGGGLITVAAPQGEGWDGGSALPPAWVEQPIVVDADGVRAVGVGRGETAEFAAERSRILAMYRLVQHVAQRIAGSPVAGAIGADPGETQAEAIANQFLTDVGQWTTPQRVNESVKVETGGFTVATQHKVEKATLDRVVAHYAQTEPFRGIVVGRRFPYAGGPSRLVVVQAESWFTGVAPGDPILQIGRTPVASFEDFQRVAPAAWRETPDGGTMLMWIEHEGKRSKIDFVRPAATKRDAKFELLPLDLPR